jgi:hypothetical protein
MRPRSMLRRFLTMAAAAACLLLVVGQATGGPGRAKQACSRPPNSSEHWNAVFSHTTSTWQATLQRRHLQPLGFRGIIFEKDYCDDVELAVPGVDSSGMRNDLVKEADASHVSVSFEPPDILKRSRPGIVKAIFGIRPTLARANKLQWDIGHVGFREGSDIERLGLHSWRVVLYNIPQDEQDSFAAEAASVGFHVTFVQQ